MSGILCKTGCATLSGRDKSKSVNVRVEANHLLLVYHDTNTFSELNHFIVTI